MKKFLKSDIFYSFKSNPVAVFAGAMSFFLIFISVFAPLLTPQNPYDSASLILMDGNLKPLEVGMNGAKYVFGSDNQGRDVYSATLYGARVSLLVGVVSVLFSLIFGCMMGLIAGYKGGKTDAIIMRIADVQLSFPAILIALLVFGVGKGLIAAKYHEEATLYLLIIAIGLANWAQYARTIRGSTMVERNKDYVHAARIIGRSPLTIMLKHVLPNVTGPILVIATINLALAIIEEATLSFLGTGMSPTQPSLGTLIRNGQQFIFSGEYWILLFPSLMLILLALSINLLGDWLRDALNPKLR